MHGTSMNLTVSPALWLAAGSSAVSLLQACVIVVPPTELSPAHPAGRIQIISGETFKPHRVMKALTSESCLAAPDDAVDAKAKMRIKANRYDVDAIVRYRCDTFNKGKDLCRRCTGDAIRWK